MGSPVVGAGVGLTRARRSGIVAGSNVSFFGDDVGIVVDVGGVKGDAGLDVGPDMKAG